MFATGAMLTRNVELKERVMNWDRVEGNWKKLKGKVREQWGKLTDDELDVIAGRREALSGRIQEIYGVTKDEAERQILQFEDSLQQDRATRTDKPSRDEGRAHRA
jgi:uncharacterized protein YjbJ (UPF0337 family)